MILRDNDTKPEFKLDESPYYLDQLIFFWKSNDLRTESEVYQK